VTAAEKRAKKEVKVETVTRKRRKTTDHNRKEKEE